MSSQNLIPTEEFVEMTNMDRTEFYLLFHTVKLPIVKKPDHFYVDMNDIRARR
jgi:hypothetical protein